MGILETIQLFANYLYLCAKNSKETNTQKNININECSSLTSRHKITEDELRCH